jgi:hypothetical protein
MLLVSNEMPAIHTRAHRYFNGVILICAVVVVCFEGASATSRAPLMLTDRLHPFFFVRARQSWMAVSTSSETFFRH